MQTYRGWAHLVCDAPKLALRDFELAIELDPKNGDAYNGRGFVLATQGQYREAVRDADEAVRRGPRVAALAVQRRAHLRPVRRRQRAARIDLIRHALELVPADERRAFWSTYVRTDPALEAVRRRPQYTRLEAEMTRRK